MSKNSCREIGIGQRDAFPTLLVELGLPRHFAPQWQKEIDSRVRRN